MPMASPMCCSGGFAQARHPRDPDTPAHGGGFVRPSVWAPPWRPSARWPFTTASRRLPRSGAKGSHASSCTNSFSRRRNSPRCAPGDQYSSVATCVQSSCHSPREVLQDQRWGGWNASTNTFSPTEPSGATAPHRGAERGLEPSPAPSGPLVKTRQPSFSGPTSAASTGMAFRIAFWSSCIIRASRRSFNHRRGSAERKRSMPRPWLDQGMPMQAMIARDIVVPP
mmetsp:Transcript_14492/g.38234  ORF Transcript_14492/g.38234 Transcript_14492/m.38234 type:complete len:225 (-) Transcript_14492:56-730(-)